MTEPNTPFSESLVPYEGYASAFYELASLMGIPAQPISPERVWREQMLPKLQENAKEAARYRHLVATCNVGFDPSEPWQLVIWEPGTGEDWKAKLNAAIDSAMTVAPA